MLNCAVTFSVSFFLSHFVGVLATACYGIRLTASSNAQNLSSPGYPDNYPDNLNCSWTITAPTDASANSVPYSMTIQITAMDTEPCCDFLTIYQGTSVTLLHRMITIYCSDGGNVLYNTNVYCNSNEWRETRLRFPATTALLIESKIAYFS